MAKPRTSRGYEPGQLQLVRGTCLYVATKLGDLLDEVVVVGGLVPSLLIDQETANIRHVGTLDLDVGLALALLEQKRYQQVAERLRLAGFSEDVNEKGNPTHQRWKIEGPPPVTVDFLIPPSEAAQQGGTVWNLEPDFAAIVAPGLALAFRDRVSVRLTGLTIRNERADRRIWISGPGAFVVLKALAFRLRGENKDAYDLVYVLQNYGESVADIAARLLPVLRENPVRTEIIADSGLS